MAVSGSRSGRMAELRLSRELREKEPGLDRADPKDQAFKFQGRRVPVVYYLCRNGQLEHPHFMDVPLSSLEGLLLRDVVSRLNVLRGKGMAAMYSWSCKRSYKNGFVWHDLLENDIIFPAHGDEYVLKGSELPATESPDANEHKSPPTVRRRRNQSCSSIDLPNLQEYGVCKTQPTSDVSTQTDDARRRRRCPPSPPRDEIELSVSPPLPESSSPETLETLMKSEIARRPEDQSTASSKLADQKTVKSSPSSSSVLMQLISCGSISCGAAPGHGGIGLISQYRMRVPRGKPKLEDKQCFSGSLIPTRKQHVPSLNRSNSYNSHR